MDEILGVVILASVLGEICLYILFPRALQWLAIIPFGKPDFVSIRPQALEALTELSEAESGYRERRTERVAIERVDNVELRAASYLAWINPARRDILIRLRYRYGFRGRGMGLSLSKLQVRGNEIVVTTRLAPLPMSVWIAFGPLAIQLRNPALLIVPAVFTLLALAVGRGTLARARRECLDDLEKSVRAFGPDDDGPTVRRRKKRRKR